MFTDTNGATNCLYKRHKCQYAAVLCVLKKMNYLVWKCVNIFFCATSIFTLTKQVNLLHKEEDPNVMKAVNAYRFSSLIHLQEIGSGRGEI